MGPKLGTQAGLIHALLDFWRRGKKELLVGNPNTTALTPDVATSTRPSPVPRCLHNSLMGLRRSPFQSPFASPTSSTCTGSLHQSSQLLRCETRTVLSTFHAQTKLHHHPHQQFKHPPGGGAAAAMTPSTGCNSCASPWLLSTVEIWVVF